MRVPRLPLTIGLTVLMALATGLSGCGRSAPTPVESTSPWVVSSSPAPGTEGVPTNTQIKVTFSEPVDPASVTILVDGLARGPLTFDGPVVTLSLQHRLFQEIPYLAVVPAGVTDLAGNRMESDFVLPFTTGFAPLGEEWTVQTSPTSANLNGVALGESRFLAVGNSGTLLSSTDGMGWDALGSPGSPGDLSAAFPIGDRWVVAGTPGALFASTGPASWMKDELAGSISTLSDLWVGYDAIYMVGTSNGNGVVVKYVSEGHWTVSDLGPQRVPRSVTRFDGGWVIVGDSGLVYTSADGVTWNDHSLSPAVGSLCKVRWDAGSGLLLAVGHSILTSADGREWVARTHPYSSLLRDIAWINLYVYGVRHALYCAVGDGGVALTSETLDHWTAANTGVDRDLLAVASGHLPFRFVAVGEGGTILTSE